MFSPNKRIYSEAKENGLSKSKKSDSITMSVKKPLGDISVNRTTEKKSIKAFQTKQPVFYKAEPAVIIEKSPKENYPDWYEDVSSYKDMQDSYEDILPRNQRIINTNIGNILQCLTPPMEKPFEIDPMFLTIPQGNSLEEFNFRFDPVELNDDIPMPDIFCDFAF